MGGLRDSEERKRVNLRVIEVVDENPKDTHLGNRLVHNEPGHDHKIRFARPDPDTDSLPAVADRKTFGKGGKRWGE